VWVCYYFPRVDTVTASVSYCAVSRVVIAVAMTDEDTDCDVHEL